MGRLWWLIFHGGKEGIFLCFVVSASLGISQVIVGEMFVSFRCHLYKDKEVLDE